MSRPAVVVLDYGFGNIRSAQRALQRAGADVEVTADPHAALDADGLVVPGVGAFAACMAGLRAVRGEVVIGKRLAGSRPVLGICVGMQVLFAEGVEHGERTEGCGEWPGVVRRLDARVCVLPPAIVAVVAPQHRVLGALLIHEHQVHDDTRVFGPRERGRYAAIADEVTLAHAVGDHAKK